MQLIAKKYEEAMDQFKSLQERSMMAQLQFNKVKCDYQLKLNMQENKAQDFERREKYLLG